MEYVCLRKTNFHGRAKIEAVQDRGDQAVRRAAVRLSSCAVRELLESLQIFQHAGHYASLSVLSVQC